MGFVFTMVGCIFNVLTEPAGLVFAGIGGLPQTGAARAADVRLLSREAHEHAVARLCVRVSVLVIAVVKACRKDFSVRRCP